MTLEPAEQPLSPLEARRRAGLPTVRYPEDLPVTQRRDEIARAIAEHQVVIVAGETGSGKTTQLPKICLDLGRGIKGTIGHTQPRRLAARTVAERIASELNTTLGSVIGYKVRFTDLVSETTLVKVMTDGILLAEIQQDRRLQAYDTLIIDEAHERSLNIDFLLGYVKDLLPRRPDLKVIITSATIDTARFSTHFDDAPVVEVSGRSYPVELRYRPIDLGGDEGAGGRAARDQTQAITEAVTELCREGPGDILVFLSGEREIRDTADALAQAVLGERHPPDIIALYARLAVHEQHRVFEAHRGRRVVLATNVAETSLTVPGIRYVVDPGAARISRYSRRTKVQRLPIEAISQASANQRAGRCGRVAPGICIRLYAEKDFEARPAFTDPEILRTNLASVILQMTSIGLGDIAAFGFLDPPDHRAIADGIALLGELGAIHPPGDGAPLRLSKIGRKLARLPVDPRLGRMIVEAETNDALREVTVIAAALSIQDPRERPADKAAAASAAHGRFVDADSDFAALLNLWHYLSETQRQLSGNQFRKRCQAEFLSYLRVREWQDIATQIRHVLRERGVRANRVPAPAEAIHRCVLAGLLSQVGVRDGDSREFLGARQARFAIAPGSALAKKPPRWVMAAELVETNRLWARTVARINPDWLERTGAHLVKRSYGEATWDQRKGSATVVERVTLYGLAVVTARQVPFGRINRAEARDLFIERALVDGDWDTKPELVTANREVLDDLRARRRSVAEAPQTTLLDFYDQRLPETVVSGRHFDTWWRSIVHVESDLLTLGAAMIVGPEADALDPDAFPSRWQRGRIGLEVSYVWQPGHLDDGVTISVPLSVLDHVGDEGFDWQVPGLRHELVVALIRTLPKPLRRHVVPAPTYAEEFLARMGPGNGPITVALASTLAGMTGEAITAKAFSWAAVPAHLRIRFVITDRHGRGLASGDDLAALRVNLDDGLRQVVIAGAHDLERHGITDWDFAELPETVSRSWAGHAVTAYVALVDEGKSVAIRVLDTKDGADQAMASGTYRLLLLTLPSPAGRLVRQWQNRDGRPEPGDVASPGRLGGPARSLARGLAGTVGSELAGDLVGDLAALAEDCTGAAVARLVEANGGPVRTKGGFTVLRAAVRDALPATASAIGTEVGAILTALTAVDARLHDLDLRSPMLEASLADVRRQVRALVRPGFVTDAGASRLPDLARYLRAAERRLEILPAGPARDQQRMLIVLRLQGEARAVGDRRAAIDIRWMIEELRVSLWAQVLGTPEPVSETRVRRAITEALPRVTAT